MVPSKETRASQSSSPRQVVAAVGQLLGSLKQQVPVPRPDRTGMGARLGETVQRHDHRMTLVTDTVHAGGSSSDVHKFALKRQRTLVPRHDGMPAVGVMYDTPVNHSRRSSNVSIS